MGHERPATATAPRTPWAPEVPVRRFLTRVHPEAGDPRELGDRRLVVGREPGAGHLTIDDALVSREHFEIAPASRTAGVLRAKDLGSKNGTLLDGAPLDRELLRGGEMLRAGDSLFVYSEVAPPPGEAPPPEVGRSVALTYARHVADVVATAPGAVLVTGPSGAGKELIARRIHEHGGRRGRLVSVSCATFTRDLVAGELFGHVRGAFTGADKARGGSFGAADGGTLFLDEIADLPLEQQPASLRALQDKRIRPVGGDRDLPVDVRIVAATHQDLDALVEGGRFRGDLLARLAGFRVHVPGLAQRKEDVLPLLRAFYGEPVEITADAAEALLVYF